jgi:hypothetical protein
VALSYVSPLMLMVASAFRASAQAVATASHRDQWRWNCRAETLSGFIADGGMSVILVEQHARMALQATRQAVVLDRGRVVHRCESDALLRDPAALQRLVAVA